MFIIPRRTVRTSQPQTAVRIDWSNPITRGLALTLCPTNGFIDAITGEAWQTWGTAPAVSIGQLGKCVDSTAAWGGLLLASNKVNLTTEAQTHLIVCYYVAKTGNYAGLFGTSDLSGTNSSIILQDVEGEHLGIYPSISSLGSTQPFSASTLLICGDALNSAVYKDSLQILSGGPAVAAHSMGRMILFGERLATTSYATRGKIYLSLSWTRRLSASEIASVSKNPWQIFEDEEDYLFIPSIAGGGGPASITGTLSATLDSINTTFQLKLNHSGTGVVSLSGISCTISATLGHSGSSSISLEDVSSTFSGSVSAAGSVSGTLSVSLADITTTAVGSLSHSGSLTSSLADVFVSMAGTVAGTPESITGTLAITLDGIGFVSSGNSGTITLTQDDIIAIKNALFADPRLLSVTKFLALKD